jgi:hypothetical protein
VDFQHALNTQKAPLKVDLHESITSNYHLINFDASSLNLNFIRLISALHFIYHFNSSHHSMIDYEDPVKYCLKSPQLSIL